MKDNEMYNPGKLYPVMELEITYYALFKSEKIHHKNHITTFADLLVKYVGMDSLMSVNHIKRARCCIQVAACVMFLLLTSAYEESGNIGPVLQ